MKLDPFYLIVDDVAWLRLLLPTGLKLVQLRIKNQPENRVRQQIVEARRLCDIHQCQLVINDHWALALQCGCDFVHLGQEDLASANLHEIRGAGMRLGISTHSPAELDTALAAQPDYIALGPIFPTILKTMPWAPQGLNRIPTWKRRIGNIPLVAIGGLNPERGQAALEAGADSVAVVTDVSLSPDPEGRVRTWLNATRQVTRA